MNQPETLQIVLMRRTRRGRESFSANHRSTSHDVTRKRLPTPWPPWHCREMQGDLVTSRTGWGLPEQNNAQE